MNPYVEIAKLLIGMIFTLVNQGKMTQEELDKVYLEESKKFEANKPETLPDV